MVMTSLICPNCEHELTVTVSVTGASRERAPHRPAPSDTVAIARDLIAGFEGLRAPFSELRSLYDDLRPLRGWPALSDKALARALRGAGARPWRTTETRGWEWDL